MYCSTHREDCLVDFVRAHCCLFSQSMVFRNSNIYRFVLDVLYAVASKCGRSILPNDRCENSTPATTQSPSRTDVQCNRCRIRCNSSQAVAGLRNAKLAQTHISGSCLGAASCFLLLRSCGERLQRVHPLSVARHADPFSRWHCYYLLLSRSYCPCSRIGRQHPPFNPASVIT